MINDQVGYDWQSATSKLAASYVLTISENTACLL